MDIMEAYQRVLDAAEELRKQGVEVKITPSTQEVDREGYPLPRDKWVIIEFFPKSEEEAAFINQKADELGWFGITFDTSGTKGQREWEVDWSFKVHETPDPNWGPARGAVEEIIKQMPDKGGMAGTSR